MGMLRGALPATLVSAALLMAATAPAAAQSQFDATGQFTLSFKFGLPGGKKELPKLGFRVGASNVPSSSLDAADPVRRGLNLDFDRRDHTAHSFSGVNLEFGEADKKTIRLFDDAFSAESLGLAGPAIESQGLGAGSDLDYLEIDSRQDRQDWLLSDEQRWTNGWIQAPVSGQ